MCVLSIKVPIRKKSGNLSYAPRISLEKTKIKIKPHSQEWNWSATSMTSCTDHAKIIFWQTHSQEHIVGLPSTKEKVANLRNDPYHPGINRQAHFNRIRNLPYSIDGVKRVCAMCFSGLSFGIERLKDVFVYLSYRSIIIHLNNHFSGVVSLFNGISTLFRLFNAKVIILEEQ